MTVNVAVGHRPKSTLYTLPTFTSYKGATKSKLRDFDTANVGQERDPHMYLNSGDQFEAIDEAFELLGAGRKREGWLAPNGHFHSLGKHAMHDLWCAAPENQKLIGDHVVKMKGQVSPRHTQHNMRAAGWIQKHGSNMYSVGDHSEETHERVRAHVRENHPDVHKVTVHMPFSKDTGRTLDMRECLDADDIIRLVLEKADNRSEREKLADLEHQQWMYWAKAVLKDVKPERREKWKKNFKPYAQLDKETKDQDRVWADKVLKVTKGADSR